MPLAQRGEPFMAFSRSQIVINNVIHNHSNAG
jgi:hypothetical protein